MSVAVWAWLERAFESLPGSEDELFDRLWTDGLLTFEGDDSNTDDVDFYNAELVMAALRRRARIFILLPDLRASRPALLFGSALLRYWFDHKDMSIGHTRPVLYFGSEVGIRDQLRSTRISGSTLDLAGVFSQQHVSRGRSRTSLVGAGAVGDEAMRSRAPEAITVYAPADAVGIMRSIRPSWIAVDVSNAGSLAWLTPLLAYAGQTGTPVVAWGQNPLSECREAFKQHCKVFTWPSASILGTSHRPPLDGDLETLFRDRAAGSVAPLVLEGPGLSDFSSELEQATRKLSAIGPGSQGRLLSDTIALHWQYLRAIEGLCIPTDLYEAEAPKIWGLSSLSHLSSACERFRTACRQSYSTPAGRLDEVATLLNAAAERLRQSEPPLWTALCSICLEEVAPATLRVIVFPSHVRKKLFQLALLSRCNISSEDLGELRVRIASLRELRAGGMGRTFASSALSTQDPVAHDLQVEWHPLVVGLPAARRAPDMSTVLRAVRLDFLLFEHQLPTFARRIGEWGDRMRPDVTGSIRVVASLAGLPPRDIRSSRDEVITLAPPVAIAVATAKRRPMPQLKRLLTLEDPVSEVAALFDSSLNEDLGEGTLEDREVSGATSEAIEAYSDTAVALKFSEGWHGLFAPDDMVNVVVVTDGGVTTDARFVRAIRNSDRVVLIHGARRQSLYELIIARVHNHPAIELHLALIRRWQEDFLAAFQRWHSTLGASGRPYQPRTLEDLLQDLKRRGSTLTSSATLYHWLQGWTLCPQDPEDMRRAADTLGMQFVAKNYRAIAKAARRVRGLHRGLANRVNRWLAGHAPGGTKGIADDTIDHELGLTFNDFRNSLVVVEVISSEIVHGPFLRSRLGQVSLEDNA